MQVYHQSLVLHLKEAAKRVREVILKQKRGNLSEKLVVFRFMGQNMPVFTRNDSNIVARGLLPEIPLIASEEDVRKEVTSVL